MKALNVLLILLVFNTFILLGFLVSEMTGNVVKSRVLINVTRVIDGDTIDTDIGKVRLLGINTPEKNQFGYEEAKEDLSSYSGMQIELEEHGKDKYERILGYIFYNNELINKKILQAGLASLYYYDKDAYYNELKTAEEMARQEEVGIWKKSKNYSCIQLIKLQYIESERCKNQEQLVINNKCGSMNVSLKDDATHIYPLELSSGLYIQNFSCIWNDEGDSLYIYDDSGLVLFSRY